MSHRNKTRRHLIKEHRRYFLDQAIGALLDGQTTPEYVGLRAAKYKESGNALTKTRHH